MDDLTELREYCEFGGHRVYLLLAVARTKERGDAGSDAAPTMHRVVEEPGEFDRLASELAHAVRAYDPRYRLYLTVNARDSLAAFFALRERTDEWLRAALGGDEGVRRKFGRVDREFLSALQSDGSRDDGRFLFDLDDVDPDEATAFREDVADETTVLLDRETPNGYHLVTDPFDYTRFESAVPRELKTDGLVFASYLD